MIHTTAARTARPARIFIRVHRVHPWLTLWTIKIKLVIAYDGTAYEGWQVQKTGTGVQEIVEAALAKLFPSKPRLHSASRTDTGVHALGMVAHFEVPGTEFKMSTRKLALALNAWLPEDIRVLSAARAPKNFMPGLMRPASNTVISSGTTRR